MSALPRSEIERLVAVEVRQTDDRRTSLETILARYGVPVD